jgi:hypothetical protein
MVPKADSYLLKVKAEGLVTEEMGEADELFYDVSTEVVKKIKQHRQQVTNDIRVIEMKFFFVTRHNTQIHYLFRKNENQSTAWSYLFSQLSRPKCFRNMKIESGFDLEELKTIFNNIKSIENIQNTKLMYTIWGIFDSGPHMLDKFFDNCKKSKSLTITFDKFMFSINSETKNREIFISTLSNTEWYIFQYKYILDCKDRGTIWLFLSKYDFELHCIALQNEDEELDINKLYDFLTTNESNIPSIRNYPSMKTCIELYLKDANNRRTINRPPYSWLFPDLDDQSTAYGNSNGFSEDVFIPISSFDDFMSEKEMEQYMKLVDPTTDIGISFVY